MRNDALREYKFKLYLNANHYVIFNGKKGESHPHTWEFAIELLVDKDKFIMFLDFEKAIDDFLEPFQDKLLNDIKPFDTIIPTLENMLDYFAPIFYEEIKKIGGLLIKIEASETASRTYVYSFRGRDEYLNDIKEHMNTALNNIVHSIVEESLDEE